ncbi:ABC transporter ATP-binding protein [Paenibacillus mendelii]|uniref:ABC transporter ATP-binding protein n=1 Tax=Paenibacillus mendelii TaxID=206163 RepID=A0ABV6JGC8_9BACL|nr:sn-glycerol-3-phosphate ABC transporter ATP-binding protein UgpC [Paenibacillus mendelii]MCQ6557472.1 sn-glycerol-3-phosphate ABC transporter ATP-binding protein UgpC [Paenibacillus mendelii]
MGSLSCRHIFKYYKGEHRPAVKDFNLEVSEGEFLVLVGPSGCGKSTMLRMIAGLEPISEGDLYIGDRYVNFVSPKNRDISMVFQNYALYPNLSVYENIALGLKLRKVAKHEVELKVNRTAKILEISHLLDRLPSQLSGGQKQRVALGRAIVREPQVFLMDEPLSNLDAKLRAQTRAEIMKLHSQLKTTTVYVTHDQTEAMTMGTRIVVMKDGEVQQVAPPQIMYDQPCNLFVASFIGSPQMNLIPGSVNRREGKYYFETKRVLWELPQRYGDSLKAATSNLRQVVLGIRPEHIGADREMPKKYPCGMTAGTIEMIELMGSDTFLFVNIGESTVIVRTEAGSPFAAGDQIEIAFRLDRIHLFDAEQGGSLTSQGVTSL